MQSLLPAVYPLLKEKYSLSFYQIGLITFSFQVTASLLQPLVGLYTDRRPWAYTLLCGTLFTLLGLLGLARADNFTAILLAAALVGVGSSIFHPEASRVARLASGGRYGFAQSFFQVGGNTGTAIGPLIAAFIVMPRGQASIAWLSLGAIAASALLTFVGRWYQRHLVFRRANPQPNRGAVASPLSPAKVKASIAILLALVFSKYIYLVSLTSYYTFYLIHHFNVPGDQCAALPVCLLGCRRGRHARRRPRRRSARLQDRDLGLDPGRAPVHARLATRELVLDGSADGSDRIDPRLGILGHHRLCARIASQPRRLGRRHVFRFRLRHGGHRRGRARLDGRPLWHRNGLPNLRIPAADGPAHLLLAEFGAWRWAKSSRCTPRVARTGCMTMFEP